METNKTFKKLLVLTSIVALAFASLTYASEVSENKRENPFTEVTKTITVTSDTKIVKRKWSFGTSDSQNNTEEKLSITDLKNDDTIFYKTDDNGKVTEIIVSQKPTEEEMKNLAKERKEKGFGKATRSNANRMPKGNKDGKGNKGFGWGGSFEGSENGQNRVPQDGNGQNPPPRGNFPRGGFGGRDGDRSPEGTQRGWRENAGNFGKISSISGNTITIKTFELKDKQGTNNK
jgi:hypothetical protein